MQEYVSWNIKNERSFLRTKAMRFEYIKNRETEGGKEEGAEEFSVVLYWKNTSARILVSRRDEVHRQKKRSRARRVV